MIDPGIVVLLDKLHTATQENTCAASTRSFFCNLGQDPEKRSTRGGKDVTIFSLATHRSIKEEDGYRNETDWHRVVAFDWMAREAIARL